VVKLTPVPRDGWILESWGGDLSGTEPTKTISVDKEKNVTVKFKRKDYQLNIIIEGEGTVTEEIISNPSGREYPFQTVVKLTPVPREGWVFESWSGDLSGNEHSKTISMDKEKTVIVKFRNPVFRLAENGVTCICENVKPSEKGFINGVEFEAVDNALLGQRRDERKDLTKLCTSLVTDLARLFENRDFNQAIGNWDVSNVTNMSEMLRGSTFNQPIGNWDVSKVTNMSFMFNQNSAFNQPIGNWDVSNVKDMAYMFNQQIAGPFIPKPAFNQPIGDWNVENVTNMSGMFANSAFNQPIGNWDVSNVKDMSVMFAQNSAFNQPIGNWDVVNVTNMNGMFFRSQFNQDLSRWCVSKFPSKPLDFDSDTPQWTLPKPVWGTCPN
jgi:surface protein